MKFFMDHLGSKTWVVRRRIIILSLLWISILVTYLSIWGRPIALSDTVATNLILLFGAIVGSYVFGAVWDMKGKSDHLSFDDDEHPAIKPKPVQEKDVKI
jgi:hypothetical protein